MDLRSSASRSETTPVRRTRGGTPGSKRGEIPPSSSRAISRRQGGVNVLVPPPPPPAVPLANCLENLRRTWQREGNLAALWQAWPDLAGPQLAPHCRPLRLQGGCLSLGAAPGPWLQALQYNRHQLLGAIRAAAFPVRELRIEQDHAGPLPPPGSSEAEQVWRQHPSRVDLHGMGTCPRCSCPAPAGEIRLWGHCGFCRRHELGRSASAEPPGSGQ
ncbi:MAG: DUF721 domain-containing protein [Cyanobacteriota bacterium]